MGWLEALAAEQRQSSCCLVILGAGKTQMLLMGQLWGSETKRLAWGHPRSSPKGCPGGTNRWQKRKLGHFPGQGKPPARVGKHSACLGSWRQEGRAPMNPGRAWQRSPRPRESEAYPRSHVFQVGLPCSLPSPPSLLSQS